jgi:hypothetical protein
MGRAPAYRLALAGLICAATWSGAASADDGMAVSVSARLTPPELPFHRSARLEITVETPADVTADTPEIPERIGTVEVRRQEPLTVALPGGRLRTTHAWMLDPVKPGHFVLALPEVGWEGGSTRPAPLALQVRDLTDAEREAAEQFSGIIAPDALPPDGGGVPWWAAVAALAVVAAAGMLLYRRLTRVVAPPPPAAAWTVAERRLRELAQRDLPGQGRHEAYYVDLSSILRYYLEDRFHLHAPEQTTQEFLETAAQSGHLDPAQQAFLAAFLRHSDRVKFARHVPGTEEMAGHFAEVERFVRETTPAPAPQAPAAPVAEGAAA